MEKLLIDIEELAEALGMKVSTVYSKYEDMGIPYIKEKGIGLKFPIKKVQIWIESNIQQGFNKLEKKNKCTKKSHQEVQFTNKPAVISTQLTSHTIKEESESLLVQAMKERRMLNSKN